MLGAHLTGIPFAGTPGQKGSKGDQGLIGLKGETGAKGDKGDMGSPGKGLVGCECSPGGWGGDWAPLCATLSVQHPLRGGLCSAYQHPGILDLVPAIQVSEGQECES